MHCVDFFFFLMVVLKILAFYTYLFIYLSWIDITPIKTKLKYVKNANIFKTTTQRFLKNQRSA